MPDPKLFTCDTHRRKSKHTTSGDDALPVRDMPYHSLSKRMRMGGAFNSLQKYKMTSTGEFPYLSAQGATNERPAQVKDHHRQPFAAQ